MLIEYQVELVSLPGSKMRVGSGSGQVGIDASELNELEMAEPIQRGSELIEGKSAATHAGIDMQMNRDGASQGPPE